MEQAVASVMSPLVGKFLDLCYFVHEKPVRGKLGVKGLVNGKAVHVLAVSVADIAGHFSASVALLAGNPSGTAAP